MTIIEKRVKCTGCRGTGIARVGEYDQEYGCSDCGGITDTSDYMRQPKIKRRGNGYLTKKFFVSTEACSRCGGNGKVAVVSTHFGKNLFGQETRHETEKTIECPDCCGKKVTLYEIEKKRCGRCGGQKTVQEWVKSFFGGEVKKDISCPSCNGRGEIERQLSWPYKGEL